MPSTSNKRALTAHELNLIEHHFLDLPEGKLDAIVDMLPTDGNQEEIEIDVHNLGRDLQWKIFNIIKEHFQLDEKTIKGETANSFGDVVESEDDEIKLEPLAGKTEDRAHAAPEQEQKKPDALVPEKFRPQRSTLASVEEEQDVEELCMDIEVSEVDPVPPFAAPSSPDHPAEPFRIGAKTVTVPGENYDSGLEESDSEDTDPLQMEFFVSRNSSGGAPAPERPEPEVELSPPGLSRNSSWEVCDNSDDKERERDAFWKKYNKVEEDLLPTQLSQESEEDIPLPPPEPTIEPIVNQHEQKDLIAELEDLIGDI